MPIKSLYEMCQIQTIAYLKEGLWDNCKNPLSRLPPRIVDGLIHLILQYMHSADVPSYRCLFHLFTSHQLQRLDLCWYADNATNDLYRSDLYYASIKYFNPNIMLKIEKKETSLLLRRLSKDHCSNLRSFIMVQDLCVSKSAIKSLIWASPNLTEVHSIINFDLNILQKCKNLQILKMHIKEKNFEVYFGRKENFLSSLTNLEEFAVCDISLECFDAYPIISKILIYCPKLTSVGLFDSSMAIKHLKTKKNHAENFKLKSCFWGIQLDNISQSTSIKSKSIKSDYKSNFSEMIRIATTSCPDVEELVIQVFHKDSLQHLTLLKRLNFLCLDFSFCDDFDVDMFISLLCEIGHQLKHLLVKGFAKGVPPVRLQIDDILRYCPNVESLRIHGPSAINHSEETSESLQRLKRLVINCIEFDDLMQILQNCVNLTELFVTFPSRLNESDLIESLPQISLWNLRMLCILGCKFSSTTLKMLLEMFPRLERLHVTEAFEYNLMVHPFLVTCSANDLNGRVEIDPFLYKYEFFSSKLYNCNK
ncbi:uncharacterized protein CDAR_458521 [Caerostris darwini]|uniref:Uncharacterized protein n=1 Tax=Caerostris darwini TaxID=1538125 RepID=A0AAV4NUY0_9ARAC|nr:uncharacterized protein CDAR_458521 [Caerostris darwini]